MRKNGDANEIKKPTWRRAEVKDLEGRELFKGVEQDALRKIASRSDIREFGAQEAVHLTRDNVSHINIILDGYIAIWINSQFTDDDETFLAWRGPEQIIGEMNSVAELPARVRIETCETCTFIEMESDNFNKVANDSVRIYQNITRLLVKKMEHERCRSEIIRMKPAGRQVAQTLLHLADERCDSEKVSALERVEGQHEPLEIPGVIHQHELAGYIGVKRETVNRPLSALRKKKIIDYGTRKQGSVITILDWKRLEKTARGGGRARRT
jgi:CRP-like cAMP-binding protein